MHANPRNLNASTMAAILNADSALTDHANNHLGINIKGFEAGSKVGELVESLLRIEVLSPFPVTLYWNFN